MAQTSADPTQDNDPTEQLRADLFYRAADTRALALEYPQHASAIIAIGDITGAVAAMLTNPEPGHRDAPAELVAVN